LREPLLSRIGIAPVLGWNDVAMWVDVRIAKFGSHPVFEAF